VSFLLPAENVLLTGDTVLGRGTTVVAHPDGELAAYLDSLERLERMTGAGAVTSIAPGHGPTVPDAAGTVRHYLAHRHERLEQVRRSAAQLDRDGAAGVAGDLADRVVAEVYADVPRAVWPAARLSVLAQLAYLRQS
jgi:glyoxylase-like metal-dependent hydrolase (beta-lactamase superfamily II)